MYIKIMSKNIEKLIVKFLNKEANFDELQQLELWISNPNNEALFLEFIKINASINKSMNKYNKVKAKENIIRRIKKEKETVTKNSKRSLSYKYAAAASIALIIALSIFFNKKITEPQFIEPIIVNNQIKTGTNKATLTLQDGSEIALEKGKTYHTKNAMSNGEEIVYQTNNQNPSTKNQDAYNTLTIARGEQFQIQLSDGTKVWLNSESQIKYPVVFNKKEPRQVELVYGEAYFDVSPSTANAGTSFKVYNKNQEIKVLGTEFNIKAYKNEVNIYTTLVEGKVAITAGNKNKILSPGEQSILNITTNNIGIAQVDIKPEISWREGVFIFKKKPLKEIMTTLSRWYDMDVVFQNKDSEVIQFNGSLNKNQSIQAILNDIKNFGIINNYEIKNKTVTIK
tara:strand:- start:230 stop:1420 length:1191 start_codon:yes stop_codon:yes gene_type:complete